MVDNLFIVESPLQALVAVELSLQLEEQTNGILYRLSGKGRERNDEQICRVIDFGAWSFREPLRLSGSVGFKRHLEIRRFTSQIGARFRNKVRNVFFGEFRSQWMHLARLAIASDKFVLMDDGAATLIVKRRFIDKGIFYPRQHWAPKNLTKKLVKNAIYWGLFDASQEKKPVTFASTFLKEESEFKVDFSYLRQRMGNASGSVILGHPKAYFFGSKYSEAGILSRDYELGFISRILNHYAEKGLDLVYCAHRDDSDEKIELIRALGSIEVVRPDLPAELFVIEHDRAILEIGAAYSSVVNNLSLMFPDKPVTSFRVSREAINPTHREAIDQVYKHFWKNEIRIESL